MKGGYIVQYTNKDGKTQKGEVLHADQRPEFEKVNKVLVRLLDDDFNPKMKDGKKVISLKNESLLKVIGFTD